MYFGLKKEIGVVMADFLIEILGLPERYTMQSVNVIAGSPLSQNGPIFQNSPYSATVEENREPGAFILAVAAVGVQVSCMILHKGCRARANHPFLLLAPDGFHLLLHIKCKIYISVKYNWSLSSFFAKSAQ